MSDSDESTAEIYDRAAQRWVRREPTSLSDFTGRPPVFDLCGDVRGARIADLGCGEGYCARILVEEMGAGAVEGIDISAKMVEAAQGAVQGDPRYRFEVGDATKPPFEAGAFDLVVAVFVYNYLSIEGTAASFAEVHRLLKPGGSFVFAVPHPAFPFIKRNKNRPFFFDFPADSGYFSARNARNFGEISRIDGVHLPVEMTHKTFQDYFEALRGAGFAALPELRELGVTAEHRRRDPDFFGPVDDIPLHLALRVEKDL